MHLDKHLILEINIYVLKKWKQCIPIAPFQIFFQSETLF